MIIVDTNVISELTRPRPNDGVMEWLDAQEPTNLYLSAVTVAELMYGAFVKPDGRKAVQLQAAIAHIVDDLFRGRVLPFDGSAARHYGIEMARLRKEGIAVGQADGQIAAIALANDRADVATRDTAPFEAFRLRVINPFTDA